MPLVFTAICPHSPQLVLTTDKAISRKLSKTKKAIKQLEEELYSAKPDVVLIITPHGKIIEGSACTINQAPILKADFVDFGDLQTKLEYRNN